MKSDENTPKEYFEEGDKIHEYDYDNALQRKMWKANKNSKFSNFVEDILSKDRITMIQNANEKITPLYPTVDLNKLNHSAQNGFLPRAAPSIKIAEPGQQCAGDGGGGGDGRDDLPNQADCHGPEIIKGVESEEVEEVNDAYNDLTNELGGWLSSISLVYLNTLQYAGLSKDSEGDYEEFVPSCGPLLLVEYLISKVDTLWSRSSSSVNPATLTDR